MPPVIGACYQQTIMEKQKPTSTTVTQDTPPQAKEAPPRQAVPTRGREIFEPEPEEPDPPSATEGIVDPRIAERGGFVRQSGEPNKGVLEAIKRVGSQRALADLMKVTQTTINSWLWDKIPAERAIALEEKTSVSRRIIRPDLFAKEPELVLSKPAFKTSVHRERYGRAED